MMGLQNVEKKIHYFGTPDGILSNDKNIIKILKTGKTWSKRSEYETKVILIVSIVKRTEQVPMKSFS